MIDRIDDKLKMLINDILDKNTLVMTYEDYSILQDYRARKLAEEAEAKRQEAWKKDHSMILSMISGLGLNGGDGNVH